MTLEAQSCSEAEAIEDDELAKLATARPTKSARLFIARPIGRVGAAVELCDRAAAGNGNIETGHERANRLARGERNGVGAKCSEVARRIRASHIGGTLLPAADWPS